MDLKSWDILYIPYKIHCHFIQEPLFSERYGNNDRAILFLRRDLKRQGTYRYIFHNCVSRLCRYQIIVHAA